MAQGNGENPPKSGLSQSGHKTHWDELFEEDAYQMPDAELEARSGPINGNGNGHHGPQDFTKTPPSFDPENPQRKPIEPLPLASWASEEPPERKWIVPGLLLRGSVTLLTGDGGLGKSLLTLQLLAACALSKPWLGMDVANVRGIGYYCEDTPDEIQRRIRDICLHYNTNEEELNESIELYSRAGQETVLMSFEQWGHEGGKPTAIYDDLMRRTEEFGSQLAIIDTAADTYQGNENIRPHVRQYVNQLRRFATATDGGVILTAHPSNEGLSSGTGRSGSTAWHNSVRGRAYLTRPKADNDQPEADIDANARVLQFMKSNYSAIPESLNLKWQEGVFIRSDLVDQRTVASGPIEALSIEAEVLSEVKFYVENGTRMSPDPQAKNYITRLVMSRPKMRRYARQMIESAKERLINDGKLIKVQIKVDSKPKLVIRHIDGKYVEE